MQITDKKKEDRIIPFFRLAFRPFFLSGALFSIVALLVWGNFLLGVWQWTFYVNPLWWHAHEMLFGFGGAIIIGFLLTAVQTWTSIPSVRGWNLALLFFIWLAARLGMLLIQEPIEWLAIVDLIWLPLSAVMLAQPVIKAKKWHNLPFVPLLLLMTAINGQMHYAAFHADHSLAMQAASSGLLLITVLMLMLGGRVIPFFTSARLDFAQPNRLRWLELMALLPTGLVLLIKVSLLSVNTSMITVLLLIACIANTWRLLRWKPWLTLSEPLLWSLHLSYAFIILGVLCFALTPIAEWIYVMALHILAIGGMGGLILAMICRVTLGHTGRPMQLPSRIVGFALALPAFSALLRSVLPELVPDLRSSFYVISILLWVVAYGTFLVFYSGMLWQKRADGKLG
ncbi:MAG: NnrS family protein [Endozoicomonadaceae bacterium]|nr:NnrS family protein [Endozoicomonadaceae bacterium]